MPIPAATPATAMAPYVAAIISGDCRGRKYTEGAARPRLPASLFLAASSSDRTAAWNTASRRRSPASALVSSLVSSLAAGAGTDCPCGWGGCVPAPVPDRAASLTLLLLVLLLLALLLALLALAEAFASAMDEK